MASVVIRLLQSIFCQKPGVGLDMADSACLPTHAGGAGDQNFSLVRKYKEANSGLVNERNQLLQKLDEAYVAIEQVWLLIFNIKCQENHLNAK